jgi:hypothetical protein
VRAYAWPLLGALALGGCKSGDGTGPASTAVAVDVSRCASTLVPPWFAFQDGPDGAWTRVVLDGGRFAFEVSGEKFGYAWVAPSAPFGPFVRYTTLGELTSNPIMFCNGTTTLTATVSGLAGGRAYVAFGGSQGNNNIEGGTVSLANARDGTFDVLAALQGGTNHGRMILRRDVTPSGGTVGAFDFSASEAFTPVTGTLSVNDDFGDNVSHSVSYRMGAACLFGRLPQGSVVAGEMLGVPPANQRATDFHIINAFAFSPLGGSNYRWVTVAQRALTDRTVTFGPYLFGVTVTTLPGPYLRLQFEGVLPFEYDSYVVASYGGASVRATVAYLTDVADVLAMPDLSGAAGWQNSWAPATGTTGTWIAQAAHLGAASVCTEGAVDIGASAQGTY